MVAEPFNRYHAVYDDDLLILPTYVWLHSIAAAAVQVQILCDCTGTHMLCKVQAHCMSSG